MLFIQTPPHYLQVLVKPGDGLVESLLLSPLLLGVAQIGAHTEAVTDTAEQVDLPWLAGLDESLLGLVAKLGSEDRVDL